MSEDSPEYEVEIETVENGVLKLDALLVSGGKVKSIKLTMDGRDPIYDLIGNIYTTCFMNGWAERKIVGYCDDEFLLQDDDKLFDNWNVALGPGLRGDWPYPIGGPIVIVGVDLDGETRSLTREEKRMFRLHPTLGATVQLEGEEEKMRVLPLLDLDPNKGP